LYSVEKYSLILLFSFAGAYMFAAASVHCSQRQVHQDAVHSAADDAAAVRM